jgi:putative heme iron utilization protein
VNIIICLFIIFTKLFLPKDKGHVKEEKINIVKLLKKNVFGHMVLSVHFVEKERQ